MDPISKDNPVSGAVALIRGLIDEGVDTVFGYPGGQVLPIYDALYDYTDKLCHVLTRHEQGATHAAEGYARATGRVGVVIVTSGPGATNVITGLSDAMMDSTPLVVITGQVGAQYLGSDAFQETDVIAITMPVTKWNIQVRRAEDLNKALARAFFIARSGRPGPVVVDISRDAQVGLVTKPYKPVNFIRSYNDHPEASEESFRAAAELINAAERPLIVAGQGVTISGAEKQLLEFAEKTSIPVATTLLGLSSVPSGHPLNMGMVGMHGNIAPNIATNRADLIIGIGMRFDDRITGDASTYAPDAKKIHIDIDASEFNKVIACDVSVHSDARAALEALLPMVEKKEKRTEWLKLFESCLKREDEVVFERELRREGDAPMTMGEVARAVSDAAGEKAIGVTDVGQNQMMSARYFRYSDPRSFISSGGLGTMGFGLPAAIGAKIGCPGRTVVAFLGDGGFQMTMQELGTIMQYGVDVKVVIMDNHFLGNVRQWQEMFFNHRFSQTPMVNPDFIAIAKAYGIEADMVSHRDDLASGVRKMLDHDGPYVLCVAIDHEDMVFPMTPAGKSINYILLDPTTVFDSEL